MDPANSPADLVAFLGYYNTGCYKQNNESGYYKIVVHTADKFAKKVNNAWQLVSLTNQWLMINEQDVPSCSMINESLISKLVTPQCWQEPTSNNSDTKPIVVPVVNP